VEDRHVPIQSDDKTDVVATALAMLMVLVMMLGTTLGEYYKITTLVIV
jgi:hypothetical protein